MPSSCSATHTGLADSSAVLLGGRIAQGVGAAMLSPAALSLLVSLFDGDERNKALGVWSLGGSTALGVLLAACSPPAQAGPGSSTPTCRSAS